MPVTITERRIPGVKANLSDKHLAQIRRFGNMVVKIGIISDPPDKLAGTTVLGSDKKEVPETPPRQPRAKTARRTRKVGSSDSGTSGTRVAKGSSGGASSKKRATNSGSSGDGGGSAITVAKVGTIHEFGLGDMPERSFIRATMDKRRDEIGEFIERSYRQVLDGIWPAYKAASVVGFFVQGEVQATIRAGLKPQVSAERLKQKLRTSRTSKSHPLIDTGQLINSVSFRVEFRTTGGQVTR